MIDWCHEQVQAIETKANEGQTLYNKEIVKAVDMDKADPAMLRAEGEDVETTTASLVTFLKAWEDKRGKGIDKLTS